MTEAWHPIFASLALIACVPLAASAADAKDSRQGYVISFENDFFGASGSNTDRWYTNGFHYAESFRRNLLPPGLTPCETLAELCWARAPITADPQ